MSGYLEKGIQIRMAQGRSTKIISMIKWSRTNSLSIKNSLSRAPQGRTPCSGPSSGRTLTLSHSHTLALSHCHTLTLTLSHSLSLKQHRARRGAAAFLLVARPRALHLPPHPPRPPPHVRPRPLLPRREYRFGCGGELRRGGLGRAGRVVSRAGRAQAVADAHGQSRVPRDALRLRTGCEPPQPCID